MLRWRNTTVNRSITHASDQSGKRMSEGKKHVNKSVYQGSKSVRLMKVVPVELFFLSIYPPGLGSYSCSSFCC